MKVIQLFLLIVTIPVFATSVFATAQEPDRIIYNGVERALFSNPLETYYQRPEDRPRFRVAPMITVGT